MEILDERTRLFLLDGVNVSKCSECSEAECHKRQTRAHLKNLLVFFYQILLHTGSVKLNFFVCILGLQLMILLIVS